MICGGQSGTGIHVHAVAGNGRTGRIIFVQQELGISSVSHAAQTLSFCFGTDAISAPAVHLVMIENWARVTP